MVVGLLCITHCCLPLRRMCGYVSGAQQMGPLHPYKKDWRLEDHIKWPQARLTGPDVELLRCYFLNDADFDEECFEIDIQASCHDSHGREYAQLWESDERRRRERDLSPERTENKRAHPTTSYADFDEEYILKLPYP